MSKRKKSKMNEVQKVNFLVIKRGKVKILREVIRDVAFSLGNFLP